MTAAFRQRGFVPSAVLCAVIAAGSLVAAHSPVQSGVAAGPAFDVASIKRSQPNPDGWSFGAQPGGRWVMVNRPISILIREAYPTQVPDLVGAPDWVTSDLYDINAKADGAPPRDQIRLMLQSLLAERFRLAMHYETQERPVFALVVARADGQPGAGLLRSNVDCEAVNGARRAGRTPDVPSPANGAAPCSWSMQAGNGAISVRFGGLPLSRLSESLGRPDGRVIVDKTGLAGNYEFTLRYTDRPTPDDDTLSIFTALEEQLGLKLVPDRAPLQVLVVDHIERPTED